MGTKVASNVRREGYRLGIVKREHSVFGIHRMGEHKMFASMKRLLSVLSVAAGLILMYSVAAPAAIFVCQEDFFTGCVGAFPPQFNGDQGTVASDGEDPFDPYGAGFDTTDGVHFSDALGHWTADATMGAGWVQLPVSEGNPNTWVLPANLTGIGCGAENETSCEPAGVWDLLGSFWVDSALGTYVILNSEGGVSDVLIASNTGPNGNAQLTFYSDPSLPAPEPASLALIGIGMAGLAFARRRKS